MLTTSADTVNLFDEEVASFDAPETDKNQLKLVGMFDYLNSIMETGKYNFSEGVTYPAFVIRAGLKQHLDCVLVANEMNKAPFLSSQMEYDFLFYSIAKKRRKRTGWVKAKADDTINMLCTKFLINEDVAALYLKLLPEEEIDEMMERHEKWTKLDAKSKKKK